MIAAGPGAVRLAFVEIEGKAELADQCRRALRRKPIAETRDMAELRGVFTGNRFLRRNIVRVLAQLSRTKFFGTKRRDIVPVTGIDRALRRAGRKPAADEGAKWAHFGKDHPVLSHAAHRIGDAREERRHIVRLDPDPSF